MKYSITTLTLLAAPFASAGALVERGALSELPDCASSATQAGISATGCAISDFACICGNSQFVTSLHSLIENVCSVSDQQITLAFAQQVCGSVGVSLNIPTPSATSSSSSSVAPAASTSATSETSYPIPTPTAPYAFANGSTSINGTNSTLPFTGAASTCQNGLGLQLAVSALSIALVMGFFL